MNCLQKDFIFFKFTSYILLFLGLCVVFCIHFEQTIPLTLIICLLITLTFNLLFIFNIYKIGYVNPFKLLFLKDKNLIDKIDFSKLTLEQQQNIYPKVRDLISTNDLHNYYETLIFNYEEKSLEVVHEFAFFQFFVVKYYIPFLNKKSELKQETQHLFLSLIKHKNFNSPLLKIIVKNDFIPVDFLYFHLKDNIEYLPIIQEKMFNVNINNF